MKTSCRGAILVETLQASTLIILVTGAVFLIVSHLWTHTYLKTEAFYLARARMYQNTSTCRPNERLLPHSWVNRSFVCNGTRIRVDYNFLPHFLIDREAKKNLHSSFSLQLLGN